MLDRLRQAWQQRQNSAPVSETAAAELSLYRFEQLLRPALLLLLLTSVLVGSALSVILSAHEFRKRFHQHQLLVQQRDDLQVEWGQLLLETGAWAANNRIEQLAVEKLNMNVPGLESIEVVRDE
ncbi:cell division protein FtsL [Marinobacterium jannaschii]|uniref:cell division protein FtsL n=1 Tax=Marinobacterium jannaschii TaxID=64970 RepID=UPI000489AB29|nr:cell division protein FtsL [Marinobacterium jannaschii]